MKHTELENIKRFAVSSLDYFDFGQDKTRVGLVSFGEREIIASKLAVGTSKDTISSSIDYISWVNGNPNLLKMLNNVEKVFINNSPAKRRKMLVIFTKSLPSQFSDDFKRRLTDINKSGIRTAFVFVNDDDTSDVKRLTDNLVTQISTSGELPVVFPDFEQFIGQASGMSFLFFNR